MKKKFYIAIACILSLGCASQAGAAPVLQSIHGSGKIVSGYLTDECCEYNYYNADLAGLSFSFAYDIQNDPVDPMIVFNFKMDPPAVTVTTPFLPGSEPYDCNCGDSYSQLLTYDFYSGSQPTVVGKQFSFSDAGYNFNFSLAGVVNSTGSQGYQASALTGHLNGWLGGAAQIRSVEFAMTDVTMTFVNSNAVPEPQSWATLIGGIALAGGAMRRRRVGPRTAVAN
nr:PEPxxWA-CTERM sorting domain-containing protein [uncultured Sphingomonas sp.]